MNGKLKALGLALMAAFAMSAVAASTAGASEQAEFTADDYPAVMTGTEKGGPEANFFETTPGTALHCDNSTYEGTLEEESTEITVTPHYTSCEATTPVGNFNATIDLNTCNYLFTAGTKVQHGSTGEAHVKCPDGNSITITVATCTVHVPEQTVGGADGEVTLTNKEGNVHADIDLEDVTATETDALFCPFEGNTHVTNGIFKATVELDGFDDLGTHHGITVDGDGDEDTIETATEGEDTDISIS